MRADETGAGELVKIVLAIVLIVVIVYIVVQIFVRAISPGEMMSMVINWGIKLVWGGIKQASLSLTTIG